MARQKYVWIFEQKVGQWIGSVTKGKKGPQPDENGKLRFKKQDYGVDSRKFRTWKIPRGIKSGDIVKVQIWSEDDLHPLDFFPKGNQVGNDVTATMLQRISKMKRLELISADSGHDKIVTMLAIALIIAVGVIGALAFLIVDKVHP